MNPIYYLDKSIATYDGDPPSNDYQRGCLDTLKIARSELASMFSWQPLSAAPRDGTMVWLLVDYGAYGEHPLTDAGRAATIGFNNFDQDGEDAWRFAGWNWEQDCFCHHERGNPVEGLPVAWLPIGFELAQESGEAGAPVVGGGAG